MRGSEIERYRYLDRMWQHTDKTSPMCVCGLRGSGKSTILRQFLDSLRQWHVPDRKILFMDMREADARNGKEMHEMIKAGIREEEMFIILDNVDAVDGWDRVVNSFGVEWKHRIYFSGNRVTARDMESKLSYRKRNLHVRPLSFEEYLGHNPRGSETHADWAMRRYLCAGGLPVVLPDDSDARAASLLRGLYETAVHEDLKDWVGMDRDSMDRVLAAVMGSDGPEDMRHYSDIAYVDDTSSTWSCLWALENWHLMDHAYVHGRECMDLFPRFRMYMEDTGILHSVLPDAPTELLMENAVYGELMRRGCRVSSGSFRRRETTFISHTDGRDEAIQVMEDLDDPIRRRWALDALERSGCRFMYLLTLENPPRDLPEDVWAYSIADWMLERPEVRRDSS